MSSKPCRCGSTCARSTALFYDAFRRHCGTMSEFHEDLADSRYCLPWPPFIASYDIVEDGGEIHGYSVLHFMVGS